jgi:hypothetical protein
VSLTAAHCTSWLEASGIPLEAVWVTFGSLVDAGSTLFHGTAHVNPNYDQNMSDPQDVSVVVLDTARLASPPRCGRRQGCSTR